MAEAYQGLTLTAPRLTTRYTLPVLVYTLTNRPTVVSPGGAEPHSLSSSSRSGQTWWVSTPHQGIAPDATTPEKAGDPGGIRHWVVDLLVCPRTRARQTPSPHTTKVTCESHAPTVRIHAPPDAANCGTTTETPRPIL